MVYTCYEMVRDCREDRPEGWRYFVRQYVPVVRRVLARYGHAGAPLDSLLSALRRPESSLFQRMDPAPERPFVAELRQRVLAELEVAAPPLALELEEVAAALEPLTLVEKQAVWLEGMGYTAAEAGEMLRMSGATVEKIRGRGTDLVRGGVDTWSSTLLRESGLALGRAAASSGGAGCLQSGTFLEVLDGRATWQAREQMERHVLTCWHCIDHYCRLLEVVDLLRANHPLTEAEAAPFERALGIAPPKRKGWKRWLTA